MSKDGKVIVINEGNVKKGNVSPPPKISRPQAPVGQSGGGSKNTSDKK
jgi:hypothetical protein